jgi:hypothetical protein
MQLSKLHMLRANFQEPLNPMIFVKLMLLAFRNVQKRCNRSYGIQITSLRFRPFLWAIAHASANFRHPGQFPGTLNPMVFIKLILLAFRNAKKCCNRSY